MADFHTREVDRMGSEWSDKGSNKFGGFNILTNVTEPTLSN